MCGGTISFNTVFEKGKYLSVHKSEKNEWYVSANQLLYSKRANAVHHFESLFKGSIKIKLNWFKISLLMASYNIVKFYIISMMQTDKNETFTLFLFLWWEIMLIPFPQNIHGWLIDIRMILIASLWVDIHIIRTLNLRKTINGFALIQSLVRCTPTVRYIPNVYCSRENVNCLKFSTTLVLVVLLWSSTTQWWCLLNSFSKGKLSKLT